MNLSQTQAGIDPVTNSGPAARQSPPLWGRELTPVRQQCTARGSAVQRKRCLAAGRPTPPTPPGPPTPAQTLCAFSRIPFPPILPLPPLLFPLPSSPPPPPHP